MNQRGISSILGFVKTFVNQLECRQNVQVFAGMWTIYVVTVVLANEWYHCMQHCRAPITPTLQKQEGDQSNSWEITEKRIKRVDDNTWNIHSSTSCVGCSGHRFLTMAAYISDNGTIMPLQIRPIKCVNASNKVYLKMQDYPFLNVFIWRNWRMLLPLIKEFLSTWSELFPSPPEWEQRGLGITSNNRRGLII